MTPYQQFLVRTIHKGLDEVANIMCFFPPAEYDREIRPGQWTLRQHLIHMRSVEQRYLERLQGVLSTGGYTPAPAPPPTAVPESDDPIEDIVSGYIVAGRRAVQVFRGLTDDQWNVTFNHPTLWGDVTVEWWAERFCQHAAEHLDELWMYHQLLGVTPDVYERVKTGI